MYETNLERKIVDNILYDVDSTIIIAVSFVTLFVNWYNNRLLPLIRKFLLIPNRSNEFVDRRQ
jgi:hypothetical protein